MTLTPEQFLQLLEAIKALRPGGYTITGAADWEMLVFLVGGLGAIAIALLGFMWVDLRSKISGDKAENKEGHDALWAELKECKRDLKECHDKCCKG